MSSPLDYSIDPRSGVPFYRQIIDRVRYGIVRGLLAPGDQLPTVRQLAADLSVNPNTVIRAYREMELGGVLDTQQGSGTYVADHRPEIDEMEKSRKLDQILTEFLARAHGYGLTLDDILGGLRQRQEEST